LEYVSRRVDVSTRSIRYPASCNALEYIGFYRMINEM